MHIHSQFTARNEKVLIKIDLNIIIAVVDVTNTFWAPWIFIVAGRTRTFRGRSFDFRRQSRPGVLMIGRYISRISNKFVAIDSSREFARIQSHKPTRTRDSRNEFPHGRANAPASSPNGGCVAVQDRSAVWCTVFQTPSEMRCVGVCHVVEFVTKRYYVRATYILFSHVFVVHFVVTILVFWLFTQKVFACCSTLLSPSKFKQDFVTSVSILFTNCQCANFVWNSRSLWWKTRTMDAEIVTQIRCHKITSSRNSNCLWCLICLSVCGLLRVPFL